MKFHGIEIPNNEYFSLDGEKILPSESLSRDFFFPLHTLLKSKLVANASTPCHINFYNVKNKIENLLASLNSNQVLELKQMQTASKIISRSRWTREQDKGERQSGVSNLGKVSELLLERALNALNDNDNFFKTNDPKVKTYGDFVLMCLPNNLWISVKSNYARERLLASGYTIDIIGVGFFTDMKEFISPSKIRNFEGVQYSVSAKFS